MIKTELYEYYYLNTPDSTETIKSVIDFIIENNDQWKSHNVMWDMRQISLHSIPTIKMRLFAVNLSITSKKRGSLKTALLVKNELQFGLFRAFISYQELRDINQQIKIFKDIENAKRWLHKYKNEW